MALHRKCGIGAQVMAVGRLERDEHDQPIIYEPLVFGPTQFWSNLRRVLSTIPVEIIQNDGDGSTSILQGEMFMRTCSLCFLQGFNLGTSHSPSFGLVWSKHDSTKLHSQMHPARDLKHVQSNSNCSMLAIKSKGTGHHFSNKKSPGFAPVQCLDLRITATPRILESLIRISESLAPRVDPANYGSREGDWYMLVHG